MTITRKPPDARASRFDARWCFWAITAALLAIGLGGFREALALAIGVSALHLHCAYLHSAGLSAMPVQVALAYLGILLLASWLPFDALLWLQTVGTTARAAFGYCALGRTLSLMPWNRRAPLSSAMLWRTYTASPATGAAVGPVNHSH